MSMRLLLETRSAVTAGAFPGERRRAARGKIRRSTTATYAPPHRQRSRVSHARHSELVLVNVVVRDKKGNLIRD